MGQTKDGGYQKLDTTTPEQRSVLNGILQGTGGGSQPLWQQSMAGLSAFLPGGTGFDPIAGEARRGFQEQTAPSIMEAMGTGARGSSALNQAMAGAGSGLESQLAALRAQMMQAAAGQGLQAAMGAAQEPMFAYQPRQQPFWQQAVLGGLGAGGQIGGGLLSNTNLFARK